MHKRSSQHVHSQSIAMPQPWLSAFKLLLLFSLVFVNAALQANPVGPVVTQGQATFDAAGNRLTVTNTPGTVINWQTFNIPAGNTTHFQQQGADSSVLNRVVTNDPSKIFGTLSSNGRVILVNQAGIVVGAGAVVDTAGFIASTLNMSEADRLLNKGRFSGSGGSIQIDGMLRSSNGDIVLIAPQIHVGTQALVKADNGTVMLAAGQQVMLTGRGLEGITLELQAPTDKVVNLGRLEGDAVGIFASQLKHSGAIVARNAVLEGGRVVLKAVDSATVDGQVDASGTGAASTGGRVTVEGNTVALQGANIASTGTTKGGQVLVGGGWQGKDASVRNSQLTTVDGNSRINVSGQGTGSAGTAVVWSDGNTAYSGDIKARGGERGGHGGQVEVSGKENLGFNGTVNIAAPQGTAGSILLDPKNIIIDISGVVAPGSVTFPAGGLVTQTFTNGSINTLLNGLVGGTLTLQATNDISVIGGIGATGMSGTFRLDAGRDINISAPITLSGANANLYATANSSLNPTPTTPERDAGPGGINQSAGINAGGSVYLAVNAGGTGGNITVAGINAGQDIVLINSATGGNINRIGVSTLAAGNQVVLDANGSIGSPSTRIATSAPKFSVGAGGNAYLDVSGPGNQTRLAPSSLIGSAANVAGLLDIAGTTQKVSFGAAGTETAPVSISAGSMTVFVGTVSFGSTSTNTAALNVSVTGFLSLTGTAGGSGVFLGSESVAPLSVSAGSLFVNGTRIRVEGAPFVTGGGNAGTTVTVAGTATFTAGSVLPGALVMQGGGGIGNTLNVTAGTLNLNANSMSAGIELLGGSAGNSAATLRASGNININAGGGGLLAQGGSDGFSTLTVVATAGRVNVDTSLGGNVTITAPTGPVAGGALVQGQTGVGITATGAVNIGSATAGSSASVKAPAGTVTVQASDLTLAAGTGTNASALVDAQNVVVNVPTGQLTLNGSPAVGNTSSAAITSVGSTSATASGINVNADQGSAAIKSLGTVYLRSITDGVFIDGGGGAGSRANVDGAGGVTVVSSVGLVGLTGGSGTSASASITSGPAGITLTVPSNNVTLNGGGGTASFASVSSTGPVTITALGLILNAGAGQDADAIVFASNSAALVVAFPSAGTVTTATLANTSTAQVGVIVTGVPGADAAVFTFAPPSAVPGSGGQFTVTVGNLGGTIDTLSLLVTGLPSGTQTVNVGALAPGATTTVVISYAVGSTATGILNPVVTVSGSLPDTSPTNNSTTGFINLLPQVNFGVTVGSTALTLGVTNGVAVSVNNTGPSAGTGTLVITNPAGGTVSLVIGLLPGTGTSTVVNFFVPVDTVAYVVAASVSTIQTDTFAGNNSASQALLVPPTPPLPVVPSVTPTATVTVPTPTVTTPTPTPTAPTPTPTLPTPTPTVPTPTPTLPTPTVTVPTPTVTVPTPTPTLPTPTPPVVVVPPTPPTLPPTAPAPNVTGNDPARQTENFPGQFARLVGLTINRELGTDDIVITDTQCRPQ